MGKRQYETDSVTSLGIQIKNLTRKQQADAMLFKLRHFLDKKTLRSVYYPILKIPLFKDSKSLLSFGKAALENSIFISKCHLRLIASSNFLLSLILTIIDRQT